MFLISDDQSQADLWLLNSCTVKNPAEDHFRNMIELVERSFTEYRYSFQLFETLLNINETVNE